MKLLTIVLALALTPFFAVADEAASSASAEVTAPAQPAKNKRRNAQHLPCCATPHSRIDGLGVVLDLLMRNRFLGSRQYRTMILQQQDNT